MAIQPGFSSKTICSFENRPICCIYKTETKYASKDEIELAVFETFREFLLAVLVLGLGVAVLVGELVGGFFLDHSVGYGDDNTDDNQTQHTNKMSSQGSENWWNR